MDWLCLPHKSGSHNSSEKFIMVTPNTHHHDMLYKPIKNDLWKWLL